MEIVAIIIILIYLINVSSILRTHKRSLKISKGNPYYDNAFNKFKMLLGRDYYSKVLSEDGIDENNPELRYVYMLFCLINNNMLVEFKPTTTPISENLIGYMFNEEKEEKEYFPSVLNNYLSFVDSIQKYVNPKAKFFNKIKESLKNIPLKWYIFDKSNFKDLSVEDNIVSLKLDETTINCKSPIIMPNFKDADSIWFIYFGLNESSSKTFLRLYSLFNIKVEKEIFELLWVYRKTEVEFILLCRDEVIHKKIKYDFT